MGETKSYYSHQRNKIKNKSKKEPAPKTIEEVWSRREGKGKLRGWGHTGAKPARLEKE